MEKKNLVFRVAMIAIIAVLVAVLTVGNYLALVVYSVSVNNVFTVAGEAEAGEGVTTAEDRLALCQQIEAEGITLLVNQNNTLPIDTSKGNVKVNLLGQRAYDIVYGGTGSGGGDTSTAIDLPTALNQNGFEVNPAIANSEVYKIENASDGGDVGFMNASLNLLDPAIEKYTGDASFESMKAYSDIAIVVLGRAGGEGSDLTSFVQTEGKHYLELSSNEEALIKKATETFGTVIVLYNGANPLELGFLETYNVDAALWIGQPGVNGMPAVANVLNGTINPSGRLVDTYAYDATSAPSWQNYGSTTFSNSPIVVVEGSSGTSENPYLFVDYVEGIYVGYRWYETAAVEGYLDYDSTVQYPFGYGLSYTTFTQQIVGGTGSGSTVYPNGEITVEVKVTNTGAVAGKEVVQLYYTSPYTEYDKTHGVEKSAVDLVAYAKTDIIEPGQSETVTLTINVEDMASFDVSHSNGDGTTGCYMLDQGTYTLSVRANSHETIDSIDVIVTEQHFYCGDDKRSTDDTAAVNQLTDSSRGVYLSRNNGFANYEEAMASVTDVATDAIVAELNADQTYDASLDEGLPTYTAGEDYRVGDYTAKEGDLTVDDLKGADYDDERWDQLISQMSVEEMITLLGNGGWSTPAIESIGKPATLDLDGPSGLNSMFDTSLKGTQYPASIVLAATWNEDLAYQFGQAIANEFHQLGVSGWYAPAMNIHRSPFSGRNFEYYSEDGYLSGVVGAYTSLGSRAGGLYAYVKHFALNDQETDRGNYLTTWSNEQATREIYLKPFEMTVKDGGAIAIMSSYNYIGTEWAGNKGSLLNSILRDEWGFQGMVITDAAASDYMTGQADATKALRNGNDLWLSMGSVVFDSDTNADIHYLRQSVKNVLYTQAQGELIPSEILPWRTWLYILDAVMVVGVAACAYFLIQDLKKNKKK